MNQSNLAASVLLLLTAGTASAQLFSVQADLSGSVTFPDDSPSSIGNENGASASVTTGQLSQFSTSTTLSLSRGGTDFNGTVGSGTIGGSVEVQPGLIHAQVGASADSHAATSGFPHANASLQFGAGPVGRFTDQITFGNAGLPFGSKLQVRIVLDVDWSESFSGSTGGGATYNATVGANGSFGLGGVGNTSVYLLRQTGGVPTGSPTASEVYNVFGGVAYDLSGQFTVFAATGVGGGTTDPVSSSASSEARAHFRFEAVTPGTTGVSASGADYMAVPEPATTGAFAGSGLVAWLLLRRRRG